jgi:hypothetical protein
MEMTPPRMAGETFTEKEKEMEMIDEGAEKKPAYPYSPEVYSDRPDTDQDKGWFIKRGAIYENGHYAGGFRGPVERSA